MTYQESITKAMTTLAKHDKSVFLGEGLVNAGRVYGTMDGVPLTKCIEFPIAENLIVGSAIGLAITGFKPIVVFQRMDFMTCACDAIVNHLSIIPKMSGGRVKLPVIIRAIIGSRCKKFELGLQHNKDLTEMFKPWIYTIVLNGKKSIDKCYQLAYKADSPTLIVEDKSLYERNYIPSRH